MTDDNDHPDTDLTDHHGEAEALRRENERLRAALHELTSPQGEWTPRTYTSGAASVAVCPICDIAGCEHLKATNSEADLPIDCPPEHGPILSDAETAQRLTQFEEYLTGGFKHGEWHYLRVKDDDGLERREAVLFFMDAEYDPVRVTFDWEGHIQIHFDGNKWCGLSVGQLDWLADMADEVNETYRAWCDGRAPEIEERWGKPDDDE